MKVAPETQSKKDVWIKPMEFDLPSGLIGIEDATRYELLINEEEAPFMWIRSVTHHELGFVVVEPHQIVSDYDVEIGDEDAKTLGIENADDALVLNIVTLRDNDIEAATVNLIAPIVINRKTGQGKQVIAVNYMKFSARHPLLADSAVSSS
ncbi:flagellar assembly protein FliW [Pelagicoccus sp. SDUM812003]|uniref:flagellar assembly protein FliW n=1 Tax=Pelagicoccus sp. SDUM812003 TaxID=3041267 RepID=UPI0028105D05|nr:flagellar assembly protein FliW [Pelagicoccus sp. SDUM812003]MDQ8202563.1 flagellar assembly protein FliW [Pelagicoccus sp. SDUM812003]